MSVYWTPLLVVVRTSAPGRPLPVQDLDHLDRLGRAVRELDRPLGAAAIRDGELEAHAATRDERQEDEQQARDGDGEAEDVEPLAPPDDVKHGRTPRGRARRGGPDDHELVLVDAVVGGLLRPLLPDHPAEHHPAQGDRREHRGQHADHEHEREALDRGAAEVPQDERGHQGRHVGVEDRAPRPVEAGLDGRVQRLAGAQLFLGPFEDEDVGVHRHAHREHEARDAGERQGHRDGPEQGEVDEHVEQQRDARDDARQPVVDEHEREHEADADEARQHGLGEEAEAEGGAQAAEADLLDLERQGAELQHCDQVVHRRPS